MTIHTDSLSQFTQQVSGYKDGPFVGVTPLGQQALDWLSRAAVYRIPEDAFKKGYSWVAEESQINAIEALERRLKVKQKKRQALELSRLDGEAYLYYDLGDTPSRELNLDRVALGKLRFVNVIRRDRITLGEMETDPLSPYYNQPKYYQMSGGKGVVTIHPSRIARFVNHPNPYDGLGISILLSTWEAIKAATAARDNTVALTEKARVYLMKMKGLMENVQDDPETVVKRYQLFSQMLKTNAMGVIDMENEDFGQVSTSFATLPEIIETMRREVSAALGIPYALLYGRSGGLGSNGEMDLKEYYDNVAVVQANDVDGPCEILNEVVIRSALGNRPDEIYLQWNPLWELTDSEKADLAVKYSTAAKTAVDAGILPAGSLSDSLVNQWTEIGAFPGLEQKWLEYQTINPDWEENSAEETDVLGRGDLPETEE